MACGCDADCGARHSGWAAFCGAHAVVFLDAAHERGVYVAAVGEVCDSGDGDDYYYSNNYRHRNNRHHNDYGRKRRGTGTTLRVKRKERVFSWQSPSFWAKMALLLSGTIFSVSSP
ncbi:MAG: hypothetical protein K6G15_09090 [Desulfovibrio sp.]|nr:hypothetical protein [Desulfovibrio sp.]